MIRAMRTAASGMQAQQMQVDTIANNIANVNTNGYKKNQLSFRSLMYRTFREPGAPTSASQNNPTGLQVGSGTEIASSTKLFMQGDLEPTANPLDVGISGEGFFELSTAGGGTAYTRDGSFRRDSTGLLVNSDGFALEPQITIPADATEVSIGQDGTVSVTQAGSATPTVVGNITLVRFPNPAGLKALGGNMFSETASSGSPTSQTPGATGTGVLRQSFRERSNVAIVDELIALIEAQRNYEVNSRTIKVSDEMMQQVGNLVR
ncbi:MAG: flagellar basal-body rod protein FlgG [Planctomycetota bacterium]|jgi:flagellar basal-body rod protein FlgG